MASQKRGGHWLPSIAQMARCRAERDYVTMAFEHLKTTETLASLQCHQGDLSITRDLRVPRCFYLRALRKAGS